MITRIATMPGTPLLIPEIAGGAAADLSEVRRAALGRVAWAAGDSGRVIVLAQDPAVSSLLRQELPDCISLAPLGSPMQVCSDGRGARMLEPVVGARPAASAPDVPVALMVAAYAAAAAGVHITDAWLVPSDPAQVTAPADPGGATGIVVIADGSSTRTPKAPGSLVEGSVEFDEELLASLETVDVDFLTDAQRSIDGERFGIQGLGAWAAAAYVTAGLNGTWEGEVDLAADPFGVCYIVAGWSGSPAVP